MISHAVSVQGDGRRDLASDEKDLLRRLAATPCTALLKRPFIVVKKGENLVQHCQRVLAQGSAAPAKHGEEPLLPRLAEFQPTTTAGGGSPHGSADLSAIAAVCSAGKACAVHVCLRLRRLDLHTGIVNGPRTGDHHTRPLTHVAAAYTSSSLIAHA